MFTIKDSKGASLLSYNFRDTAGFKIKRPHVIISEVNCLQFSTYQDAQSVCDLLNKETDYQFSTQPLFTDEEVAFMEKGGVLYDYKNSNFDYCIHKKQVLKREHNYDGSIWEWKNIHLS